MRALAVLLLVVVGEVSAAHPQYLLDDTHLAFLRKKVAANTQDWRDIKSACDAKVDAVVRWPNAVGDTSGEMMPGSGVDTANPVVPDYAGAFFLDDAYLLGACYQAIKPTNPGKASRYAQKARYIMQAATDEPAWATVGAATYATIVGQSKTWGKTGQTAKYWISDASIKAGDSITVTGAKGCTSANGTFTVSAYTSGYVLVQDPPTLDADCTNHGINILNDAAFGFRMYPLLVSVLYDWFYDEWTTDERTRMVQTLNRWTLDEEKRQNQHLHPDSNYFYGLLGGWAAAYVATDGDNPRSAELLAEINYRVTGPDKLRDYRNRWLVDGWSGEGWNAYGSNGMLALVRAMYVLYLHGLDWRQDPIRLDPLNSVLRAYLNYVTPPKTAMDELEYVSRGGGADEPSYISLNSTLFYRYAAARMSSPYAAKFANWYDTVRDALKVWSDAGKTPPWYQNRYTGSRPSEAATFLYYDAAAPAESFTALPLSFRGWSGNYAVARSSWANDAVYMTFWGSPTIGDAGNGKTQFPGGTITVQRGDTHFLIHGLGESARNTARISSACHNDLHNERLKYQNKKESIFFAERPGGARLQGIGGLPLQPGQRFSTATHPTNLDRSESTAAYEYFRASGLGALYTGSTVDRKGHANTWTRQVLFLRPKVIVVHDLTSTVYPDDDRAMLWAFGRIPSEVSATPGLHRFDVADGGTFKGAITTVLPSGHVSAVVPHTTASTNCPNPLDLIYRVEVRPAALDHPSDNYLAVLDAANSSRNVGTVTPLMGKNIDAVQLPALGVAAFAQSDPPVLPMTYVYSGSAQHRVAGLAPNTTYGVSISSGQVTIAEDGGIAMRSSNAGVLDFDSSGGQAFKMSLNLTPAALSFTCAAGEPGPGRPISITSTGGALDNFSVTNTQDWLTITPSSGHSGAEVTMKADCSSLASGVYADTISLASSTPGLANPRETIRVTLTVAASHGKRDRIDEQPQPRTR